MGGPVYRSVPLPNCNLGLAFDGVDDRVFLPDSELFHLEHSLTIEASIEIDSYPASDAELSHIVFRGDDRAGFDPWFLSVTKSGLVRFLIADAFSEASVVVSPEPMPIGRMIHVAATLNDETGRQCLFIHGKRVASTKTKIRACGSLTGVNPGIGIGNRFMPSNQGFCGTIAEVRISDEALKPKQFLSFKEMKALQKKASRSDVKE